MSHKGTSSTENPTMAEKEEGVIEVRSLSGQSTTVSISSSKTVKDLKLLLMQCFSPAAKSPNFHLFLKGVKLSLPSRIENHLINSGDFLVLVPFTKKTKVRDNEGDTSMSTTQARNESATSNVAESTYSDMMRELSYLRNASSNVNQPNSLPYGRDNQMQPFSGNQRLLDKLISGMLQSVDMDIFSNETCGSLVKILDSVRCLSNTQSGNCMLSRAANLRGSDSPLLSCICPPWLKMNMKAFTFLNVVSGLLQMQRKRLMIDYVTKTLDKLGEFGVPLGIEDIKNLPILCPKVVSFVNDEAVSKNSDDVLLVVTLSSEQEQMVKGNLRTGILVSKCIRAMKKRETLFKTTLLDAFERYMSIRKCAYEKEVSLEDILLSMKDANKLVSANKAERAVRSSKAPLLQTRCHETCPLSPMEMAEHIRKGIGSQGQIVHVEEIGARAAALTEIPSELSEKAQSALESLGISKLYSHQAESVRASLAGKNVVLSTMTSSGKSLCYNLPVLEKLSQDMLSCALYLFPTKALAQDQLRSLLTMTGGIGTDLNISIYDGDTSQTDRISLRDNTRLLITNPDMLHMSILPCHAQFKRILSNLRFVIIDEAHCYKGAFGCHTALILRRLRRLCSHVYGSDPSFIFCTATSANPKEHAMELANLQTLELIQKDGSPSGPKLFLLWNPPLCFKNVPKKAANGKNPIFNSMMKRSSPIVEVACLFAEMVQHGLRCIGFCKTRKLCELVLSYTREILQDSAPHLVNSVCAYRAGYVAEDRRIIERDFFGGKIHGIAATNALELGIDVGLVDVTLHLGFPGSIASMWQQAGRSGRRGRPSLAVYVAFEGPLDQYFMNFPHKLFTSPIECCHIDTQNRQLLEQHLICAALEHPLSLIYDETYFGPSLSGAIKALENKGYLSFDPSRASSTRIWSYIGHEKMPSWSISIRSIDSEKFKVIDELKDKVIEEIEESRAFFQVYEGAVYMNQGRSYLVTKIDLSSKVAYAKEADLKYYTKSRDYTDIHVVGGDIAYPASASSSRSSRTTAQAHCCKVTTIWFGFYRIWKGSNQVFDTVELSLPEYSYESQAVWIRVPQQVKMAVEIDERLQFRAGLHAASHAVLNVVPLFIICNSSDLAPECANPRDGRYFPERILLYDQHPGGNGLSRQIRLVFTEILTAALELLTLCCCIGESGCPDCVQSLACHENNEVLHKDVAIMIIKGVLEAETASVGFPCPFKAA